MSGSPPTDDELDVAIVGAGSAGTYLAYRGPAARSRGMHRSGGAPASPVLLEAVRGWLVAAHPGAAVPALSAGSAFQHWGVDPREVGWHFWRAGANSDEMMDLAAQPDPRLPIHLCGEVFSRRQAWVEGALETADAVATRLIE